jgi:hypothetical protein
MRRWKYNKPNPQQEKDYKCFLMTFINAKVSAMQSNMKTWGRPIWFIILINTWNRGRKERIKMMIGTRTRLKNAW